MARTSDRRGAARIQLNPTINASLSHVPVVVADVSTTGARIQHESPLMLLPGKRFSLQFTCEGQQFAITCVVARSRMELSPATRRIVYTSGLRFVDVDEFTIARLWATMAFPASAVVADQLSSTTTTTAFQILQH